MTIITTEQDDDFKDKQQKQIN